MDTTEIVAQVSGAGTAVTAVGFAVIGVVTGIFAVRKILSLIGR